MTIATRARKTAAASSSRPTGSMHCRAILEIDGALVIYNAASLKKLRRQPMDKPSGNFNICNKITRSPGAQPLTGRCAILYGQAQGSEG